MKYLIVFAITVFSSLSTAQRFSPQASNRIYCDDGVFKYVFILDQNKLSQIHGRNVLQKPIYVSMDFGKDRVDTYQLALTTSPITVYYAYFGSQSYQGYADVARLGTKVRVGPCKRDFVDPGPMIGHESEPYGFNQSPYNSVR